MERRGCREAKFGDELTVEQLGQVKEVLKEFRKQSIFSNQPGKTHLMHAASHQSGRGATSQNAQIPLTSCISETC